MKKSIIDEIKSYLYFIEESESKKIALINSKNDIIVSGVLIFELKKAILPKGAHVYNRGFFYNYFGKKYFNDC